MLTRIVGVALLAGCLAGAAVAVLQYTAVEPIILEAEVYEKAPMDHGKGAMVMPGAASSTATAAATGLACSATLPVPAVEEDEGWMPQNGLMRSSITLVSHMGAAVGYALMLLALMLAAGERIDWRRALSWGIAGFAVCGLAPAMGLAPELPGSPASDLTMRQLWWVSTAVATGGGIWLLLKTEGTWLKALGVLLLLAPHAIGAPQPPSEFGKAPAGLAVIFAARSIGLQAVLWLLLGCFAGYFWSRGEPSTQRSARGG